MPPAVNKTAAALAALAERTKLTSFMGFEMEQQTRTMFIDLLVACVVIAFIVLPSMCCQVSGPNLKPRDDWEKVIEKHRDEYKLKQKQMQKNGGTANPGVRDPVSTSASTREGGYSRVNTSEESSVLGNSGKQKD